MVNLTMARNEITVIEDKTRAFLGFFHPKGSTTIETLKLLDNTLIRQKGDREYTRAEFLYSFVNFGATSEIRGNQVVTDRSNPSRGLYFRNVTTPFEFEFSNNRDSFEAELLPTSGTAF